MPGRIHVIGAGLSGLASAVKLVRAGQDVMVHEGTGHGGGRCRSFHDGILDRRIDNGNHLILSGNHAVLGYLKEIGGDAGLTGPETAEFPFLELGSGLRWTVRPGDGAIPWWILSRHRRVPGTRVSEYLRALRLARAPRDATVASCLDRGGLLFKRFWEPLAVAVLNASAEEGAASLLWPVLRETFGRGGAACRPLIAEEGLSECFVDPALRLLGDRIRFNKRLRALGLEPGRVVSLDFGGEAIELGPEDRVILSVPPQAAAGLVEGIVTPRGSRAIVNGHFRLDQGRRTMSYLGLAGGLAQWLFVRHDVASVTVSAADGLMDDAAEDIARLLWPEVAFALDLGDAPLPAYRIVKERRATFAQTPANARARPGVRTPWNNLYLAGDWTDTRLPATLEGAVSSGWAAADAVLNS